tara:strand:+ start:168 stop:563 length:396 start_codon:yes stop_codon:yes gene_type:complete
LCTREASSAWLSLLDVTDHEGGTEGAGGEAMSVGLSVTVSTLSLSLRAGSITIKSAAELFPATSRGSGGGRHVGCTVTSADGTAEGIAGPSGLGPSRNVGADVCKGVLEVLPDLAARGSGLLASECWSERL